MLSPLERSVKSEQRSALNLECLVWIKCIAAKDHVLPNLFNTFFPEEVILKLEGWAESALPPSLLE